MTRNTPGQGGFVKPQGLAVDRRRGLVYVVDQQQGFVAVFSATTPNRFLGTFGEQLLTRGESIFVDEKDGTLYVADEEGGPPAADPEDENTGVILVYAAPVTDGAGEIIQFPKFVTKIGAGDFMDDGEGVGAYRYGDEVYVFGIDEDEGVIHIWERSSGTMVGTLGTGTAGDGPDQLDSADGLAIWNDRLYVSDQKNQAVKVWNMSDIFDGDRLP